MQCHFVSSLFSAQFHRYSPYGHVIIVIGVCFSSYYEILLLSFPFTVLGCDQSHSVSLLKGLSVSL